MRRQTSLLIAGLALSLSGLTTAVCTGNAIAIGTGHTVTAGYTTWQIYDTACNVLNTYSQPSTVTLCDSRVFHCTFGTKNIGQYDDPVTGWAYSTTMDTVAEACGSDVIINCGYAFWGQEPDGNPLQS